MHEFLVNNMAPLMFASMVLFLLLGFPVAFSLAANGILFGVIGISLDLLQPQLFQALPERIFGIMANETLLAVPFFTFMGLVLERSGMAEDLLDTIGQLFGPVRGGLAFAVIFVGALLAATTGVVAASVISMGLISLPIMMRYGYDHKLASGVIAASGTLAQIIPPSLVLIVMADQLGRNVGDMYQGALIPGLVLTGLYASWVALVAIFRPDAAPAMPPEARTIREADGSSGLVSLAVLTVISVACAVFFAKTAFEPGTAGDKVAVVSTMVGIGVAFVASLADRMLKLGLLSNMAHKVSFVLMPPLALIFLVLGSIFISIATPTEGGAMGAIGALIMAVSRKRLDLAALKQAMESTMRLSCFVVFILIGSTVFTLTFRGVDGDLWVEHLLTGLPGGELGFLLVVNLLVFFLAFFLDYFELAFIIIPLLAPVAEKMGIDLIWFGVLLAVNMQTSFMHPPFGFSLFFLRSVAPKTVKTSSIYWGAIPFVLIQLIMVAIVISFPDIVSYDGKHKHDTDAPINLDEQLHSLQLNNSQEPDSNDLMRRLQGLDDSDHPAAEPSSHNTADLLRQLQGLDSDLSSESVTSSVEESGDSGVVRNKESDLLRQLQGE